MRVVLGNGGLELDLEEFTRLTQAFQKVHLDLGTGDGRFVFKTAIANPTTLYIGLDPNEKQLQIYSKKAIKHKLPNCLYVLGSIELFPKEFAHKITDLSIFLPWGTLLQSVITMQPDFCKLLADQFNLKGTNTLTMLFGYSQEAEPSEIKRLGLDTLTMTTIYTNMVPNLTQAGFKVTCVRQVEKQDLRTVETTWAKKLSFGKTRPLFKLEAEYQPY